MNAYAARAAAVWIRLIAGSTARKTRLHDQLGARVPLSRLLRNGPRALLTGLSRLLLGYRPARPWISYDVQPLFAQHLNPGSRVLEFGSGMSTIWFAHRAGRVISLEHDPEWFALIERRLRAFGNVDYFYAEDPRTYFAGIPGEQFDLILIDGPWRTDLALAAIFHLAPGGIIYLDNCDKFPDARQVLQDFARKASLPMREFTDFAPTQLFVQRGLMVGG
ncbi:MAG: class I SAM-dependent methyltransferase [Croceibacterium sp.]